MSGVSNQTFISVVTPVYLAEAIVSEFVRRVSIELSKLSNHFEIVMVDDGSLDSSWNEIELQCKTNKGVKGIKLSRNFGQHYAVTAGLKCASGDIIIIMDCDLQDDPELIPLLINKSREGFDIVFTERLERKHTALKQIFSQAYNVLFSIFSNSSYNVDTGSLVLFSARVKEIFLSMPEKDRLYIQLLKWVGFNQTTVAVKHKPRFAGKSSYNFGKLVRLGIQGWTSHSDKLLKMSIYGGFMLSFGTFIAGVYIIARYFITGFQPGWPSLFVAILFSTGLILSSIGIAGIYIGKIFQETKKRPLYIVDKKLNFD